MRHGLVTRAAQYMGNGRSTLAGDRICRSRRRPQTRDAPDDRVGAELAEFWYNPANGSVILRLACASDRETLRLANRVNGSSLESLFESPVAGGCNRQVIRARCGKNFPRLEILTLHTTRKVVTLPIIQRASVRLRRDSGPSARTQSLIEEISSWPRRKQRRRARRNPSI